MFKKAIIALFIALIPNIAFANQFADNYCANKIKSLPFEELRYVCLKFSYLKKPITYLDYYNGNIYEAGLVMRINRTNLRYIRKNEMIVLPVFVIADINFYAPFSQDAQDKEKHFVFDPQKLAWAAYENGKLVKWGPGSSGANYCPDISRSCRTPTGQFKVLEKKKVWYRSTLYPVGCKGVQCAKMPYYMKFRGEGEGFHGSTDLPGYNASHGCIRLMKEDSKWLNEQFIDIGTKVVVKEY